MYSFTPLPGYFSPFPHGTRPLSVTRRYLGLPGGPGRFTANSTSSLLLGNTSKTPPHSFRLRGSHPLRHAIPSASTNHARHPGSWQTPHTDAPQPRTHNPCQVSHAHGLASSAFARHYSRNHGCFLFLRVLRCFTSPRSPPTPYRFRWW